MLRCTTLQRTLCLRVNPSVEPPSGLSLPMSDLDKSASAAHKVRALRSRTIRSLPTRFPPSFISAR